MEALLLDKPFREKKMFLKKGKTSNRGNESFVKKGVKLEHFVSLILAYIQKINHLRSEKVKASKIFREKSRY